MANQIITQNPILDPASPYFFISKRESRRSPRHFLSKWWKLSFLDQSNDNDTQFREHDIESSILPIILWMETAFKIWEDLRERYYKGCIFRISELGEIYNVKQENLSIGAYFTQIKGL
ncbi:hypothetical protein Lalb_Chr20g0114881 [Lupinus albus]|uniref:Retrotransposon gag domain-containing protein n=1 Tax=Lupinus albus TaxID=3870 RepID=A0A6A4NWQ2_LUPAL|nr:hypothetical protein Lalb_Chr20g0114881 [Lupinus albus]